MTWRVLAPIRGPGLPEVALNQDQVFGLGDKLIFNGETGEIVDLGPEHMTLRMEDAQGERIVDYDREDWLQLQVYAITSHRAQGSEWANVVVVVSQSTNSR